MRRGLPTPGAPGGPASADELTKALEELQQAFTKWDGIAIHRASKTTRFSFFTALLGPVAVLLLTVQILAFPHTSAIAITLIGLELAALLFALIVGFAHFGRRPTPGYATACVPRSYDGSGTWSPRGSAHI